jgi:hypothetical protein
MMKIVMTMMMRQQRWLAEDDNDVDDEDVVDLGDHSGVKMIMMMMTIMIMIKTMTMMTMMASTMATTFLFAAAMLLICSLHKCLRVSNMSRLNGSLQV